MASLICLTPIKNEEWILDRFLKCTSLWADHIILLDQNSTDKSRDIAKQYEKVRYLTNSSSKFNEPERQKILIDEARKISGDKILLALDADEFLTSNFISSIEWQTLFNAAPGTILRFQWVNVLPDMENCWLPSTDRIFGFVDDESEHCGQDIHSQRVPVPISAPSICFRDIKVLHYQYVDWNRMKSKQRWYQCWEKIHHPDRRDSDIFRQYHHMDAIPASAIRPLCAEWLSQYIHKQIDMTSLSKTSNYWWDDEVLNWFDKYGQNKFVKLNIWKINWNPSDKTLLNKHLNGDPRNLVDKFIHIWLILTQPFFSVYGSTKASKAAKKIVQIIDKLFLIIGY